MKEGDQMNLTLGEAKKKAISLMLEFSNDGVPIPDGENADYLLSMNRFASDAQMEISNRLGIESSFTINKIRVNEQGVTKYPLPDDFKSLQFITLYDETFTDYQLRNGQLWINNRYEGLFEVFYEKNPTLLDSSTPESYEFEVDNHVQHLIAYYMGGMALSEEKEDISNKLLNIYFEGLNNISNFKNRAYSTVRSIDNW